MKKFPLVVLCLGFLGCTSAVIPNYLPDQQPYTRRFVTGFDQTLKGVRRALMELGWEIEQTADPFVYEQDQTRTPDQRAILIMSSVRQTPLFIGTRYAKMNIFIRSQGDQSEVEIRYLTITSLPFKNISSYKNETAAHRIFEYMTKVMDQKTE